MSCILREPMNHWWPCSLWWPKYKGCWPLRAHPSKSNTISRRCRLIMVNSAGTAPIPSLSFCAVVPLCLLARKSAYIREEHVYAYRVVATGLIGCLGYYSRKPISSRHRSLRHAASIFELFTASRVRAPSLSTGPGTGRGRFLTETPLELAEFLFRISGRCV